MLHGILSGKNTFCSIEELCNFFGVDTTAAIVKPYKKGKQEQNILTKTFQQNLDTLVDFRCGELTIDNIHHNLIMTAFVDFMMYIVQHKGNMCKSQHTMESVYGAGTFRNFTTFLTQFRPNNRTFRTSGPPPDSYDANLSNVSEEISKIVKLCSSVKCHIDPSHLRTAHRLLHLSPVPPSEQPLSLPPAAEAQAQAQEGPHQSGCAIM